MPDLSPSACAQRLAEHDRDVLHRVVGVDLDVAGRPAPRGRTRVLAQRGEHVVEERHPGGDLGVPGPVEVDLDEDARLLGHALHAPGAAHALPVWLTRGARTCTTSSVIDRLLPVGPGGDALRGLAAADLPRRRRAPGSRAPRAPSTSAATGPTTTGPAGRARGRAGSRPGPRPPPRGAGSSCAGSRRAASAGRRRDQVERALGERLGEVVALGAHRQVAGAARRSGRTRVCETSTAVTFQPCSASQSASPPSPAPRSSAVPGSRPSATSRQRRVDPAAPDLLAGPRRSAPRTAGLPSRPSRSRPGGRPRRPGRR